MRHLGAQAGDGPHRRRSHDSVPNRLVATIFGAVYLLLDVFGFFIVDTALNILALNTADHSLHLASEIVLLGVGLALDLRTTTARATV